MPKYKQNEPTAGFSLLEEGDYKVRVENAENEVASSSGNDMIKLTLAVDGRSNKLFERLVFTEPAFWKIDQVRAGLGFDVQEGEEIDVEANDFIGEEGWVHVEHEDYQGKPVARITYWIINPGDIKALEEHAGDQKSAEAAQAPVF